MEGQIVEDHRGLARPIPTRSGYNPVLSRCVDSSNLTDEELEALLSPPLIQGPGNAPGTRATDHEAGTSDASGTMSALPAPISVGLAFALQSPPSSQSSSSGAQSPDPAIEGAEPLVSPDSQIPDHGGGAISGAQGYRWKANSCWLDSSLELIFQTARRDWDGFIRRFSDAPSSTKLRHVYDALAHRHRLTAEGPSKNPGRELSARRDRLRELLLKWGAIKAMDSREPSFVRQSRLFSAWIAWLTDI